METGGDDEIFKNKYKTSIMENQRFNNDNFINLMQLKKSNNDATAVVAAIPPIFHSNSKPNSEAEKCASSSENIVSSQAQGVGDANNGAGEPKFNNNNNNGSGVGNKNVDNTYYEAESDDGDNSSEPSHHARRPMNAFLIFCKRHRAVVRQKFPTLENRAVTKILGEWWASLDETDKESYTALAKQYKDAFFNANPNFKWYKLPAPPLRTLHTRPGNVPRQLTLQLDRSETSPDHLKPSDLGKWNSHASGVGISSLSGFTPGKLADETQLGNLCSLIDPNYHSPTEETPNNNNNNINVNNNDQLLNQTKTNYGMMKVNQSQSQHHVTTTTPPFDSNNSSKSQKSSTSATTSFYTNAMGTMTESKPLTFTNLRNHIAMSNSPQHSMDSGNQMKLNSSTSSDSDCQNRSMISHSDEDDDEDEDDFVHKKLSKSIAVRTKGYSVRKSGRSCKGKRYAEFMTEGRLTTTKRHRHSKDFPNEISIAETSSPEEVAAPPIADNIRTSSPPPVEIPFRKRTISNGSDDSVSRKMFRAADFNLDEKIDALPSLSLEKFQQRKRENKKRKKFVSKHHHTSSTAATSGSSAPHPKKYVKKNLNNNNNSISGPLETDIVGEANLKSSMKGSRKRKARKTCITHLEPLEPTLTHTEPPTVATNANVDLCDLATLAEVAVKLSNNNNS